MTKKEEQEMEESVNKSQVIKVEEHRGLSVPGIGIQGLEEADPATIPLPFVRLVQPTSKGVRLSDGSEASVGSYFFSDTATAIENPEIIILKGKHGVKTFDDMTTGKPVQKKILAVLGVLSGTEKVFILTLSVMSFNGFGKFMASLKEKKATSSFQYKVTLGSHLIENEKGKFYVADFNLGEELPDEEYVKMGELYEQYKSVVSSKPFDESQEEAVEENQESNPKTINGTSVPVNPDIEF